MTEIICRLDALSERECREFDFSLQGESAPAFLLRLGEAVVAYHNACPHTGAPLNWMPGQFLSSDQAYIQCALHGALFRPSDGYCLYGPCHGESLKPVTILVEAGVISTKSL